jgi:hypothetical protein
MKDKLYQKIRDIAAGRFFDGIELVDDLGYEIIRVRDDGMILQVEGGRRFNITVTEVEPDRKVS